MRSHQIRSSSLRFWRNIQDGKRWPVFPQAETASLFYGVNIQVTTNYCKK
jgi:hypothetical protein